MIKLDIIQGGQKSGNLEFDNLGKKDLKKPGTQEILKKTWKNLEF